MDGIVGVLFQAKMASVVTPDGTANLATYGLDKPELMVSLGAGTTKTELALGKEDANGNLFARELAQPLIFTVDKTLAEELRKSVDDFRQKELFEFRSFNATQMEIVAAGTTYSFTRKKSEGDNATDVWTLTSPITQTADIGKMTDLLTAISNLRAGSFVPAAFTTGDTMTITVKFGEGASAKTDTVTLRKSGDIVHAIRVGEPGAAVVPTIDFSRVLEILKAIAGN